MVAEEKKTKGHRGYTIVYTVLKPFAVAAGKVSINIEKALENAKEKLREYNLIGQDAEKRDYMYENEFLLRGEHRLPKGLGKHLKLYGGSIVIGETAGGSKIHLHTDKPDKSLTYLLKGAVYKNQPEIKIENLDDQIKEQEWIYKRVAVESPVDLVQKVIKFINKDTIGISLNDLLNFYGQPSQKGELFEFITVEVPKTFVQKIIDSTGKDTFKISSSDISVYINEIMHPKQ